MHSPSQYSVHGQIQQSCKKVPAAVFIDWCLWLQCLDEDSQSFVCLLAVPSLESFPNLAKLALYPVFLRLAHDLAVGHSVAIGCLRTSLFIFLHGFPLVAEIQDFTGDVWLFYPLWFPSTSSAVVRSTSLMFSVRVSTSLCACRV